MTDSARLVERFRQLLGPANVHIDAEIPDRLLDEPRGRFRNRPVVALRPATTAEVAAILRLCAEHGLPVVTRGGGTGTVGGASAGADRREVLVSLERLRTRLEVNAAAGTLTADAGITLAEARAAAHEHELELPLWLASEGTATVGGVIATNAGGNTTIRHGNARSLLRGLEAVLADGRVLNRLDRPRKDNTGYDLVQLLAGSEGTLGVITAVTLGLVPRPRQRFTALCGLNDVSGAIELLAGARANLGETLSAFELIPRFALELSIAHLPGARDPLDAAHAWYALIEADSALDGDFLAQAGEGWLGAGLEAGQINDAVIAQSGSQADALWALREAISPAQRAAGASIKHDISVPIAQIPTMIEATLAELREAIPGIRPCVFGHAGDGNLHFNLSRPVDCSDEGFRAHEPTINRIVFDRVQALAGSIAAEHGIGQLRVDELARRGDPVALELQRAIKRALDPDNRLNPGKLIDPGAP
ncbi:MAG: FAD-binding oxidoreductase [Wenzhouxiangellaceae bacterium]|nr:FAD-binding oxidoreductase [Wenzhouxiangellaceae bacterium]